MGVFAGWIEDIPGDGPRLHAVADGLSSASTEAWRIRDEMRDSGRAAPSWEGRARDAFDDELDQVCASGASLASGVDSALRAVDTYAWLVDSAKQSVADLRGRMADIDEAWELAPQDERRAQFFFLLPEAMSLLGRYHEVLSRVRSEAIACGAVVCEAVHLEPVNLDPNGNNVGELHVLTVDEMTAMWEGFDSLSYRDVRQGGIGDCYYLAGLMAVLASPEGRAWLKSCVRVRRRPRTDGVPGFVVDGFFVTVYDDPLHPEESAKREVFVDSTYQRGVNGLKPNMVSVFESAYGQIHPGGTLDSGPYNGIGGGSRAEALQDITNVTPGGVSRHQGFFGWGEGYHSEDREQIMRALSERRPMTAGTGSAPEAHFPDAGWADVEVTINGAEQSIRIPHGHAFMVEEATSEGVTLRNPWGHNRTSNGYPVSASFVMSWEDFGHYYGDVAIGGPYR